MMNEIKLKCIFVGFFLKKVVFFSSVYYMQYYRWMNKISPFIVNHLLRGLYSIFHIKINLTKDLIISYSVFYLICFVSVKLTISKEKLVCFCWKINTFCMCGKFYVSIFFGKDIEQKLNDVVKLKSLKFTYPSQLLILISWIRGLFIK